MKQRSSSVPPRSHKAREQNKQKTAAKEHKPKTAKSAEKPTEVWSAPSEKPPFNLDTRIEGYDDVDEKGRYKRSGGQVKVKVDRHRQEELNQQWIESLRE